MIVCMVRKFALYMLFWFTNIVLENYKFTLLKVRVSLLGMSTAVTVVIRYAHTDLTLKKAKNAFLIAPDSAVAQVLSKKQLFVLTDGKARISKRAN